ncbi:hypothetical protein FRC11_008347 [Ceratobasidium sp. 423]|nr:hypothetical protein FRC11_008347 [Ceratobasidium sp. 423]
MHAQWDLYYDDTDEEEIKEVERILRTPSLCQTDYGSWDQDASPINPGDVTRDSSFFTAATDASSLSFWSGSSISIDGETSFATTLGDEDSKRFMVQPESPMLRFGFLKSTEECLADVAQTVVMIQNTRSHSPCGQRSRSAGLRIETSHVRSQSTYVRPSAVRRPSRPFYWRHNKSGDLRYIAVPAHLTHLRQTGNRWTYSLTGPWYKRADPSVGDVHFSPSEVAGFDYWVYTVIGNEGVWCLTPLAQAHPLTDELVLQHLSVDSPPQWALSWPGLNPDFLYVH